MRFLFVFVLKIFFFPRICRFNSLFAKRVKKIYPTIIQENIFASDFVKQLTLFAASDQSNVFFPTAKNIL